MLPVAAPEPQLPKICVVGGALARNVRQAERILARATRDEPSEGVYQRSGELVRVLRLGAATYDNGIIRPADTLRIEPVSSEYMRYRLCDIAYWYGPTPEGRVQTRPAGPGRVHPLQGGRRLAEHAHLAGIIEAPTMRQDGSIITEAGYERSTGLYYDPGATVFPPIPEWPSRQDAERALRLLLLDVLREFPFVSDAARSVALALLMTPLVRPSVPTAPLFGLDAPTPGTGKGLLLAPPELHCHGARPVHDQPMGGRQRGEEKAARRDARGLPVNVIDNVEEPLKSDALCTILTEGELRERVIRSSRTATGDAA